MFKAAFIFFLARGLHDSQSDLKKDCELCVERRIPHRSSFLSIFLLYFAHTRIK